MMKRWMKASVMLILFFFLLIGCEKDQVAAPEAKEDVNQSEEQLVEADVAAEDETIEIEASEDEGESVEKLDGSENTSGEEQDAKPTQEQKSTSHEPTQQESTQSETSPQQKTTKTAKSTEPVTKQAQPKQSASNGQKETSEQPKEEGKVATPPAKEKPSTEPTKPQAEPEKPKQTVTITIVAPDVKGTILPVTTVEMVQGDTVLSITQKIAKERGIQISVTGSRATAYVQGIDNLYEFDHGPLSGWEAFVNGKALDKSAGIYGVQAGQAIEWRYTKNYME